MAAGSKRYRAANMKYAEQWFRDHKYECILIREYDGRVRYRISKDGAARFFDLSDDVSDIRGHMELFEKSEALKRDMSSHFGGSGR